MAVSCICAVAESGSHRGLPQRGAPRQVGRGPRARQGSAPSSRPLPTPQASASTLAACQHAEGLGGGRGASWRRGPWTEWAMKTASQGTEGPGQSRWGAMVRAGWGHCRGRRAEVPGRRSSSRAWASFHGLGEGGHGLEVPLNRAMLSACGPRGPPLAEGPTTSAHRARLAQVVRPRTQGTADLLRRGQDPEGTPGSFPFPEEVCGQGLGRGRLRRSRAPVAGTECRAQAHTTGFLGYVLRMPSPPTSSLRTGRWLALLPSNSSADALSRAQSLVGCPDLCVSTFLCPWAQRLK